MIEVKVKVILIESQLFSHSLTIAAASWIPNWKFITYKFTLLYTKQYIYEQYWRFGIYKWNIVVD